MITQQYESTAHQLRDRIIALIPSRPEILELNDTWGLFKVDGFNCDDLGPSFAQAMWALSAAKHEYQQTPKGPDHARQ